MFYSNGNTSALCVCFKKEYVQFIFYVSLIFISSLKPYRLRTPLLLSIPQKFVRDASEWNIAYYIRIIADIIWVVVWATILYMWGHSYSLWRIKIKLTSRQIYILEVHLNTVVRCININISIVVCHNIFVLMIIKNTPGTTFVRRCTILLRKLFVSRIISLHLWI